MTHHPLDISGTRTVRLVLPITDEDQQALREAGVPIPDPAEVVLLLREASNRERARYGTDMEPGGPAQRDGQGWVTGLLLRRAEPGTDPRVMREVVNGLGPTDTAMLTHAYLTGVLPDPKAAAGAVQATLTGMTNGLLGTLASAGPSPS